MSIIKRIEINGFSFVLSNLSIHTQIGLPIRNTDIARAIAQRDPAILAALDQVFRDAEEIESILIAEENFQTWEQTPYAEDKERALQMILHSQYASCHLKRQARAELANPLPI